MSKKPVLLGTLVCRYCGRIVDEVDTEKATIVYGLCEAHKGAVRVPKERDTAAEVAVDDGRHP